MQTIESPTETVEQSSQDRPWFAPARHSLAATLTSPSSSPSLARRR